MVKENTAVVLVEPQGALNIGSVCRVMMNFGYVDLRLVNPRADHLSREARDMAVKAGKLLPRAGLFSSLAEALADCHLSFGTTRRFGKYREDCLLPGQMHDPLARLHPGQRTALVFGREDSGLTTAELALCRYFITIPTDPELPSMNLAQAVAVCLYELSTFAPGLPPAEPARELADSRTLEDMYSHMRRTLTRAEYLDPQNPDHILRTFRRLFGRAGLDQREVRILHGLWSRIDWLNDEIKKG